MAAADLKSQLGLIEESEVAALRGMGLGSLRNERAKGKGRPISASVEKSFTRWKSCVRISRHRLSRQNARRR